MDDVQAKAPAHWLVVMALITVQLLFGINYVVSKVVVMAFPPLVWASIRIVIASGFMIGTALALGRKHPSDGIKFFGPLVGFALLGTIINQSSFLVGLHYTTSTNSAILNTLIPIFTLMVVTIRGQEPLTKLKAAGFVSALTGVLIMRKVEEISFSSSTVIGDLLTMLNCLSFALFLSFSKNFLEKHDRIWTTAWLFVYGSVGLGTISIPSWQTFTPPTFTPLLLGCMAFSIVGATILTYFLNIWALTYSRSSSVALFIYLQPVVAALLAWAWLGEVITARTFFSSLLIFLGMVLALNRKEKAGGHGHGAKSDAPHRNPIPEPALPAQR